VALIYQTARDVAYKRLKRMLTSADPNQQVWEPRDAEMEVRLANGSVLRFKGSDNPDSIYGEDYDAAVIDEASRCKPEAWFAVRSTLTKTRGPVRIIGNVKGRKNWAYRLGQRAKAGEQGMAYHKLTAHDAVEAGVLAKEEVEDAERILPPQVFRELYLAEPTDDGANPFDVRAIERNVRPLSSKPPVSFGVDLARSIDWTVVVGIDAEGTVCRFERWQGVDWSQTIERVARIVGSVETMADSSGVGDPIVEELQRRCPCVEGVKFSLQSKQDLMERLSKAIQTNAVGYPEGPIVDELLSFEFEYVSRGVRYSAPDGLHDDCVMALSLAVRRLEPGQTARFGFRII
jgi:phage FluMu gp28-like protein